ncbi:hypothetical protein RJ641_013037 [Dillenia turbinata]|uniref:separase n=1 Tax=Dillenia turbinata TaxID=194707 RepID=A0AAN8WF72_9MAGN
MDSDTLISRLESTTIITTAADCKSLHQHVSNYLHPFSDLISPQNDAANQTIARSLAKKFFPFLSRALSILPKLLKSKNDDVSAPALFAVYRLCLDCMECVSSQLSGKPYSVHLQRIRLVHCLESWGLFKEAEIECFSLLGKIRVLNFKGKKTDPDFALLFVEIIVTIIKCASLRSGPDKESEIYDFERVLNLVDEVKPWFRVLDANTYEKLHRILVTYLSKCAQFLIGVVDSYGENLVRKFCLATVNEHEKSSFTVEQIQKFARRICSALFSQTEISDPVVLDIMTCLLDSAVCHCKNAEVEFLDLVSYCANKCRIGRARLCSAVAGHLNKIAKKIFQLLAPYNLIMRLYAAGLYIDCHVRPSSSETDNTATMRENSDVLQKLTFLVGVLEACFYADSKERRTNLGDGVNNNIGQTCSEIATAFETSMKCEQKNQETYVLMYLNALRFLCQPLAEFINTERKQILVKTETGSFPANVSIIQVTLQQFCDMFTRCQRFKCEQEQDIIHENKKALLTVAVAAFTLSLRTKHNFQGSVSFVQHLILSECIQIQELKFLLASLYNVGVFLYRSKDFKEASEALDLCCKVSWTCASLLCKMHKNKSNGECDDLSEDSLVDFIEETCARSAFLLDILHQCGSDALNTVVLDNIEKWSVAGELFERLPSAMPLLKKWVEITCKHSMQVGVDNDASTLYLLLSSSAKIDRRKIGIVMEQVLQAYEEMNRVCPQLSQKMKMKIMDILLKDIYISEDTLLERPRIYMKKGKVLWASGTVGLEGAIECLSGAIDVIEGNKCSEMYSDSLCHQLAVAYCLRALCFQEFEPTSKQVLQDIDAAIDYWSSASPPDRWSANDKCNMAPQTMTGLLYHIFDLLSLKGYLGRQRVIQKLILKLCTLKNVGLEKCLALLWESRRLSHALCASPINEEFILNLSEYCGEHSYSIGLWLKCINASQPLLVGFQQHFSFLYSIFHCDSCHHESSCGSDSTIDEVKMVALNLIRTVPPSSRAIFVGAYLYYDLSEKLISNGKLVEALFHAKEALRLRSKLFQEKFVYSVEEQSKKETEDNDINQKFSFTLGNIRVCRSVALEVWPYAAVSGDIDDFIVSPWNVLQCYLESTLQVGIIHEITGYGGEAKTHLMWGKSISCSFGLTNFKVAFSSVLGKIYFREGLRDLAEKELVSAKQLMVDDAVSVSCSNCRLIQEVTIDQHLGLLYTNEVACSTGKQGLNAERLYDSVLDKLKFHHWMNDINDFRKERSEWMKNRMLMEDLEIGASNVASCASTETESQEIFSICKGLEANVAGKKTRKIKKGLEPVAKKKSSRLDENLRVTRARCRSSQSKSGDTSDEVQDLKIFKTCISVVNQTELFEKHRGSLDGVGCEVALYCCKSKCWRSAPTRVMQPGLRNCFLDMKWEFIRRRLSLSLLADIGKFYGACGEFHKMQKRFLECIALLASMNPCRQNYSSASPFLLDLIGVEISGDMFALERASVLYSICWFALRSHHLKDPRVLCCEFSSMELPKMASWLMLAFVLCHEVPILLKEVSTLLATLFVLSSPNGPFASSLSSYKVLSISHWASFFHQASVGMHLNHQLFSKWKYQDSMEAKLSSVTESTSIGTEACNLMRPPKSSRDIQKIVEGFFECLPCSTVICLSFLGDPYASLLRDLLQYPPAHAWMMLSRLNPEEQPVVVLLPLDPVCKDASQNDDDDEDNNHFGSSGLIMDEPGGQWHCPWGSAVVDDIVPVFKLILAENYSSSCVVPLENTQNNRFLWWTRRKKLDQCLQKLLRELEDSGLGPWKYLLLGELSDSKKLDTVNKKLVRDLKVKCKMEVNQNLLRLIIGSGKDACENKLFVSQLLLGKGCCISRVECFDERIPKVSPETLQLIVAATNALEEECTKREPIILVLDSEVQMLPWENIPLLRQQEVYRMPSVCCILAAVHRSHHFGEGIGKSNNGAFPLIDPLDAFYVLNPSGDLHSTQVQFENWFADQKFEGKAGTAPTTEELASALKRHDLFIYFGHGSGTKYFPQKEIQKLETCAATLLMGCSSGALSLDGHYSPQGTPLSYLLAGSPIVVCNLWEVTDKDIDRFGKAMLEAWLKERSALADSCVHCIDLVNDLKSMDINSNKGKGKKKASRKKQAEVLDKSSGHNYCSHRPKLGAFMSQARDACTLPFLIGAAPVCYGVPTGIRKKDS